MPRTTVACRQRHARRFADARRGGNRLDHNQNRIDRYQANARSDGRATAATSAAASTDAEQPEPAHLQRPPQRAHAAHGARAAAAPAAMAAGGRAGQHDDRRRRASSSLSRAGAAAAPVCSRRRPRRRRRGRRARRTAPRPTYAAPSGAAADAQPITQVWNGTSRRRTWRVLSSPGAAVAPVGLAQLALQDLAGRVARQRVDEVDRLRQPCSRRSARARRRSARPA